MRRAALAVALGLALATIGSAQETGKTETRQEQTGDPMIVWEWVNFILLGAGIGYLIAKNVPALFRKQSEEIQKALADAAKVKRDADAQAAAIERRFAGLKAEIESLRQSAQAEMNAESERIRRDGERHLERIREQSAQEVELMTRGAKDELRRYSASLALDLAGERVRARMTPAAQESLVDGFLQDLRERVEPRAASN